MSITRRTLEFWGVAGDTVSETSTNAVQNIDTGVAGILFKLSGVLISGIFITCSANHLRYAFGVDPVSGGLGHVLQKDGDGIWIRGADNIRNLRFKSAVDGAHAFLAITPFYGDE